MGQWLRWSGAGNPISLVRAHTARVPKPACPVTRLHERVSSDGVPLLDLFLRNHYHKSSVDCARPPVAIGGQDEVKAEHLFLGASAAG
jgi:hypothetical protein